ncbi:MAG TPA: fibronectin type III domain-containing protein [Candidatus Binatia bacterium]|nr:fibronectin type III domain-containing protein [Candidatus Binatia bacterium]
MIGRRRKVNIVAFLTAGCLALSGIGTALQAQSTVTLAWDPSPDPAVTGYKLYQGLASQSYSITNNVGKATSITVSNLTAGVTCYFAVTSYDLNQLESPFSGEISYTVPSAVGTAAQPQISVNHSGQVVLSGAAPAGYTYSVMATSDFQTWTTIGTLIVSTNGTFHFTDPAAATSSMRFYRLRQIATIPMASLQLTVNNAKQPVLTGAAPAGYAYAVMATSDFQNWTTNGTLTVSANGTFQFTDPTAATGSRRFYRLRQTIPATSPPPPPLPLSVSFSPAALSASFLGLTAPQQGTVQAVASGGTGPFVYAWTDVSTGQLLSTITKQITSGLDTFAALYSFTINGASLNLTVKNPYPWNTRTFQCTVTDTATGKVVSREITVNFYP